MPASTPVRIAVHGAAGRMGEAILRAALDRTDSVPVAAWVRGGSALDGRPLSATFGASAPALSYTSRIPADADPHVLIDFSLPVAFDAALAEALARGIAFVSGTTGLRPAQRQALDEASRSIPVLWSANFSVGIALLSRLVAEAARALPDWDCEITEAHHAAKLDAPSGTALALGREVAAARARDFTASAVLTRAGAGTRREDGSIGFSAIRAGDIVGEHTVMFATRGERIELTHRATDRAIFARGALHAALWIAGRAAGCHTLIDTL
ncbi:MAG: 4-hydroxy-tetrahydrodipicolinate reductase [Rhodanobacter sp.]|jgi:4-hydroxy-tetrahydrodipicolinate reductase|nr:4-hydroxy-tetrahydrodipicolinate reductase [Rhodanobacter sp.]